MSDDLPNGWVWAEMQDICSKVQDGTHFSPKEQSSVGDYKYITAKNIKSWGVDLTNVTYVSEKVHRPIYERCNPEKGDVLYIKDGATTGVATVNTLDEEFSLLSSVALFKPIRGVLLPNYLKWYLNSPSGFKAMTDQMTGSAITRLVLRTLRKSRIPIAPLLEQRRIVAKLETVLSKVDASQQRLAKIPVLLKRFRQSVLAAACSGRLTADWREENPTIQAAASLIKNAQFQIAEPDDELPELPEKWKWVALGNYARCFRGKFSPRPRNDPRYFNGQHPFIQIGNLPREGGLVNSHIQTLNDEGLAVSRKFPKGTVVIAIVGATIGNTGVLAYDMCVTDSIVGLETSDKLGNRYVELFLRHKKNDIRQTSYSSGGQPNINLAALNPYPLALPPLPEQQEIVRRVESLFALAHQLEARLAKAQGQMDKLTPSLLARAFSGKLVPQDPTDEPADTLLALIRAEAGNSESDMLLRRGRKAV